MLLLINDNPLYLVLIYSLKSDRKNANNNSDKCSPCQTPVSQAKYPDVLPDIEMQDFALYTLNK